MKEQKLWGNHLFAQYVHVMDRNKFVLSKHLKRGFCVKLSVAMPADDSYDRVRRDFEELEIEKRTRFLIEASASTLAKGIEQVGHVLAEGLADVMHRERRSKARSEERGPGAAEPETAQRQAPPHDASSAD